MDNNRDREIYEAFNRLYPEDTGGYGKKRDAKALRKILIFAVVIIAGFVVYQFARTAGPDRLDYYEVAAAPNDDGSLTIKYTYKWQVRSSAKDKPMTWVQVGLANADYQLLETGGAIKGERVASAGCIGFELNRHYYKGDVVEFWFTIRQENLLYRDESVSPYYFYEFTPGWFEDMRVKEYRFLWQYSDDVRGHNADGSEGTSLYWKGRLKAGEKRAMEVAYSSTAFRSAPAQISAVSGGSDKPGKGSDGMQVTMYPLFVVAVLALLAWFHRWASGGEYYRGSSYGKW